MIITISGYPGAGKTTLGKALAKKLGYRFLSAGDIRGMMAMEKGMTIDELNKLGEKEGWTDIEVDRYIEKLGKEKDNLVIDSRLAYHFIPHSVKIFLEVDPWVGAERIFKDKREDESFESVEDAVKRLKERVESDKRRYKKYYNIDFPEKSKFDLILDTTHMSKEEVLSKVLEFLKKRGLRI